MSKTERTAPHPVAVGTVARHSMVMHAAVSAKFSKHPPLQRRARSVGVIGAENLDAPESCLYCVNMNDSTLDTNDRKGMIAR